jgi:uncharacterized damage-inducible protein DinB
MHLTPLFQYKAWANAEILAALEKIDAGAAPDAHKSAVRILNHTYVVDQIFAAQLTGQPHGFAAPNTPETPTIAALRSGIEMSDAWFIDYASSVTAAQLSEKITFTFTDGDSGQMTREEMLVHLLMHGGYHRGAAGRILAQLDIAPPRDLLTKFLHTTEPARRSA